MNRSFVFASLTAAALWLSGCAGMADYPIGIPSSSSSKFYVAMTATASAHGFTASPGAPPGGGIVVRNGEGDVLSYVDRFDGIHLILLVKTDGLTPDDIAQRKVKIKALSDQLVNEARTSAQQAKAFE